MLCLSSLLAASCLADDLSHGIVADAVEKKESEEQGGAKSSAKESRHKPQVRRASNGSDIIPAATVDAHNFPSLATAFDTLRAAQLHIKFAVAEHGNVREFDAALKLLDTANRRQPRHSAAETDSNEEQRLQRRLTETLGSLQRETATMRLIASRTLFGRFPLIRTFGLKGEEDEEFQVETYSMPGEARRRAIRKALTQIAKSAVLDPVYAVVLVPGEGVEERTTSEFATLVDAQSPPAFAGVHDARLYLGPVRGELDPMPAWDAPDPAFGPVCRQFLKLVDREGASRSVMVVMVREFVTESADGYWVQAQHRSFSAATLKTAEEEPDDLEMDKSRVVEALARDRSDCRFTIVAGSVVLFIVSILIHGGLSTKLAPQPGGWQRWLAIPAAGFLIGLTLPPLIMLALGRWLPDPQTNAVMGAWWPSLAGALSLILPAGVFRLGAGSIGRYLPSFSCHGRWGISFVPVALGVSAAWLRPADYALGVSSLPLVAAIAVAAALLVYCFGRAIDLADQFPVAMTPVVLVLALGFGAGAFLASPWAMWGDAALAGIATALHTVIVRRREASPAEPEGSLAETPGRGVRRPRTIEQLRAALDAPIYQPPAEFERLKVSVERSGLSHSTWIGLVGPCAAGKSAAAKQLISELQASDKDLRILVGRCAEGSLPYQPFREALADLGVSAGLLAAGRSGAEVNNIFDRLADEFIPFWDFFSSRGDDGEEGSRSDVIAAITNALHTLAQQHRVVLFLDDIQWLDEGSIAVLKHLRQSFAPGREIGVIIIVASRDPQVLHDLELDEAIFSLTPPSPAEQVLILERSLGIENATARRLVSALGVLSQESGGMFWLLRAVRELATQDAFVVTSRGFALRRSHLQEGRLPVPVAMRAKLVESLRASGDNQSVLECAALLGERFRVSDLAECLEMDRLKLLEILRRLDRDLQLVRDLPFDQDCYAFSSAFLHEIVREELGVGGNRDGGQAQPSKLAREWHARIARVFERRSPRTPPLTFAIAQHYFEAGTAYASQALDHCLAATRLAQHKQMLREADRYRAMAEQSARLAHRTIDVAAESSIPSNSDSPPSARNRTAKAC